MQPASCYLVGHGFLYYPFIFDWIVQIARKCLESNVAAIVVLEMSECVSHETTFDFDTSISSVNAKLDFKSTLHRALTSSKALCTRNDRSNKVEYRLPKLDRQNCSDGTTQSAGCCSFKICFARIKLSAK